MSRTRSQLRFPSRARSAAGAILLLALTMPRPSWAADAGTVAGWVATRAGAPVSGAVVSLFAAAHGSFVAVSDAEGRFTVDVPAGRYALRTVARGLTAPAVRRVTVAAGREIAVHVQVAAESPVVAASAPAPESSAWSELEWLVRHKRRSVLEERAHTFLSDVDMRRSTGPFDGSAWLLAGEGDGATALTLDGALSHGAWTLSGVLPSGSEPAWRATAALEIAPDPRQAWRVASAYRAREGIAMWLAEGRWTPARGVALSGSMRYADQPQNGSEGAVDPSATVELSGLVAGGAWARFRTTGRLALPGGDPLFGPDRAGTRVLTPSRDDWHPRRLRRRDAQIAQPWRAGSVGVHAFVESSDEQPPLSPLPGSGARSTLARGGGVVLGAHLSPAITGSVTYTRGRMIDRRHTPLQSEDGFDEVVTRVEARLPRSRTRVATYYRLHRLDRDVVARRFDVQVRQGLPFLDPMAHARWEAVVAVRNLVYESTEAGSLDELLTAQPPVRVVGGISIQF